MNWNFLLIGYIVWLALGVFWIGRPLFKRLRWGKIYGIYFSALVLAYLGTGFFPIALAASFFSQKQVDVFSPELEWEKFLERELTDILFLEDGSIKGFFLDLESGKWQEQVIAEKIKSPPPTALTPLPYPFHSPWVPTAYRKDSLLIHSKTEIQASKALVHLEDDSLAVSDKHIPGNVFAWDGTGIYFTRQEKIFLRLYYFDLEANLTSRLPLVAKGHFYNPYYWKSAEMLFYSGITRKDDRFVLGLYMQKAEDSVLKRPIKILKEIDTPLIKISGNADGRLFCLVDEFSQRLTLYDMNFYPFEVAKLIQEGGTGFELGYWLLLPEIKEVRSASFHPRESNKLCVLGKSRKDGKPTMAVYKLKTGLRGSFDPSILEWVMVLMSLFLGGFLLHQLRVLTRIEKS